MKDTELELTFTEALELAKQHHQDGDLQHAESIYRQLLEFDANNSDVLHLLGILAFQTRYYPDAIALIQQAISIKPSVATYYNDLGNIYYELLELNEAERCYRHALSLNPQYVHAHSHLGNVLSDQKKYKEALQHYQYALSLNPNDADIYYNLGAAFGEQKQLSQAIECYEKALEINPTHFNSYNNLGNALAKQAQHDKAVICYKSALTINPNADWVYSNFLFASNYNSEYSRKDIFLEHQEFNQRYALSPNQIGKTHVAKSFQGKKLRIAYLSPDFRAHSVAYFIEPILIHHDRQQFEIYCYYNNKITDEKTKRFQSLADQWLNCYHLTDDELAERIRQDQIAILVDLAGHTDKSRLLVFPRKPAPVQVTYLGYPNTTGLTSVNYRITDHYVDPEGESEAFNSETLVRVAACFFCYLPSENSPPINKLPSLEQGYITFSSFNNYAKINLPLLQLWAQVLKRVPNSKLLLKTDILQQNKARDEFVQNMEILGISVDRLIFSSYQGSIDYLKTYHQVDIALDSFPFNGGTTTCEALWMGIPVITLVGETSVSRMGLSLLSTVGLQECIATTPEQYVDLCVRLASDLDKLNELRQTMRARMQASPLMQAKEFTQQLEQLYYQMWDSFCLLSNSD